MRRLVRRLERAGIPYAIMGGMAVYATAIAEPPTIWTCS
jgi:hypothetical protein